MNWCDGGGIGAMVVVVELVSYEVVVVVVGVVLDGLIVGN